jgi:hypothetical protein
MTLVLAALIVVPRSVGAANHPLDFALPRAADLPGHATLVPVDVPGPSPASVDLGKAEDAAIRQADLLPPQRWEIEALAEDLGPDIGSAFVFVRDSIGLDPYPGLLRGAQGTLAARSGSALDRAVLLAALLDAGGHSRRLAFGDLDTAAEAGILARAFVGPSAPVDDPSPAAVMTVDGEAILKRARRDHALLVEAVGEQLGRNEALGREAALASAGDVRRHAWVQVATADGTWLDLDPTLQDSEPGDTLVPATSTLTEVPDGDRHSVVIRIVAEVDEAGTLHPRTLLEERLDAAEAAEAELWLTFQTPGQGLGSSLTDVLGAPTRVPVLILSGEPRRGSEFSIATAGPSDGEAPSEGDGLFGGSRDDDLFGGSGDEEAMEGSGNGFLDDLLGGAPILAGLRLEFESWAPEHEPLVAQRVLWDSDGSAGRLEDALAGMHHIMVSTGGSSPRDHAIGRAFAANFAANDLRDEASLAEFAVQDLLLPLAVADDTIVLASERLIVDGLEVQAGEPPLRAFVARPRVFISSLLPWPEVEGGSAVLTDLALDDLGVALGDGASAAQAAHLRVWYGALQSALETELAIRRALAVDPATRSVRSVSLAMTGSVRLADADDLAGGPALAREAVAEGELVVLVGDQTETATFWAIEPSVGRTRSIMGPGLRIGFNGGGNYTNASGGGPRYIVDERTGRPLGFERDGKRYLYKRNPTVRCSGGTEYVVILGCISIPASWVVGVTVGATVVAIISWSAVIIMLL